MGSLLVPACWVFLAWLIVKALQKAYIGLKGRTEVRSEQDDDVPVRVRAGSGRDTYRIPPEPGISDECWVPPGRQESVKGYTIPSGMIYVGEQLTSLDGHQVEPALINPALPVDDTVSDPEGSSFGYWPSYSRIPPHARATYLGWLARGRKDPYIGIGYVFLFFYGIERRCLADARNSERAASEMKALEREVERLLSIYGNHKAFRRYACGFLDYLNLSRMTGEKRVLDEPPPMESSWELPLKLKFGLARMAADRIPLPVDWALTWVLSHHETKLRTPAKRCEEEFRALFRIRYQERFGEGMILEPTKAPLTLTYQPASASFGREISASMPFCDVTAVKTQVRQLGETVSQCQEELAAYSRLLGRDPKAGGSLPALALLPTPLFSREGEAGSSDFRGWLDEQLGGNDLVAVDSSELVRRWPTRHSDRMLKTETVLLAQLFEKWRLGLEPDPRFVGPPLRAKGKTVIFRIRDDGSHAPSEEYLSARMLLHLAVLISGADGEVSEDERRQLERNLSRALHLTSGEEIRLWAHFQWLLEDPPDPGRIRKRVETLPEADRQRIGRVLISVASSDGVVNPSEVRIRSKIYDTLGLDPEAFSGPMDPSSGSSPPKEEMETVPTAFTGSGEAVAWKQPVETAAVQTEEAGGIVLDMNRMRRIREDTAQVSALLSEVFSGEEDPPFAAAPQEQLVAGLDPAHSALLKALIEKDSWPRSEFEGLAARWGLLPEGAVENLNEAAWDRVGETLCEDEDPILVDHAVLEEMLT